tara:strand:+ start:729 stop:956 length:228 start_codon:yes stop_codon:yes gene_type:complete
MKMRYTLKLANRIEQHKEKLFKEFNFTYLESDTTMREVFERVMAKYGKMSVIGIDKDGSESLIEDIDNEMSKLYN